MPAYSKDILLKEIYCEECLLFDLERQHFFDHGGDVLAHMNEVLVEDALHLRFVGDKQLGR